jgi:serine/threonine protein phosphatase PrpC
MTLGKSVGLSDTGRKRRRNEDSFVREPPLFAVADGMGGAPAGEVASRLAATALRETDGDGTNGEERVAALIQEANRRVYQRSSEDAAASGMGTTMTAALLDADTGVLSIGHVGDSRAYLIRDGRVDQLTEDHSLVAELVRSGKLSPEEAEVHPQRSVITRALGTDPDVDVDTFSIQTQPGDLYLLCSDGLTTMVSDGEILEQVERHRSDLDAVARALVTAANRGGGEDNITVVIFEIEDDDAPRSTEETVDMHAPTIEAPHLRFEEEDTLSGLEPVPAVNTMVLSQAEIQEALAREGRRRKRAEKGERPSIAATVLLLLLVALIVALVVWGLTR